LGVGRARYHANAKKYSILRRINRLRKQSDVDVAHISELLREVAAIKTVSGGAFREKVRFVRGK
jgi:thiamine biosynthesis lipoprotein ApbE